MDVDLVEVGNSIFEYHLQGYKTLFKLMSKSILYITRVKKYYQRGYIAHISFQIICEKGWIYQGQYFKKLS